MADRTIKLDINTFIVADYTYGILQGFSLPYRSREEYPCVFGDESQFKQVLMRASQAKKLGFEGFVL